MPNSKHEEGDFIMYAINISTPFIIDKSEMEKAKQENKNKRTKVPKIPESIHALFTTDKEDNDRWDVDSK